jgi:hypothetical protein
MSVLETPRIYFRGEMSWDPITTNNYCSNYDENTGESILPAAVNQVAAFRQQAIGDVTQIGNWNPHGTHRSKLFNTSICGFDLGGGLKTDDPFVSACVNFNGMLVDLEPYGSISSQLFFDAMQFGLDGGYRISAPRTSRMIARYINFGRNSANTMIAGVASVVWTTSFAKADGLRVDAFDSPALQALAKAMDAPDVDGLTVQMNAYRTVYYDDSNLTNGSKQSQAAAQALTDKLNTGGFQPNPARSLLVGVIGLWRKGEPAHEPGGRALVLAPGNSPLGGAHCRIDNETLTLDFSNTVPEVDKALTKQDLGTLSVGYVDSTSQQFTSLASFGYDRYNKSAYEASAGIIDLPVTAALAKDAASQDLQVRQSDGTVLLAEIAARGIPAVPNQYLDEGETTTLVFDVYNRGVRAGAGVPVTLYQMNSSGAGSLSPIAAKTDKNGVVTIPLPSTLSPITAMVPSFSNLDQPSGGIDTQINTYMYIRIRPSGAATAQLEPTWDNVFAYVLANWNALAPCMDNWLRLDDPVQVKAYAAVLKRLTDPAHFENYLFMPVTRDMTAGERSLLWKYLDGVKVEAAPQAVARRSVKPNLAAMSRAMRRPVR